MSKKKIYKIAEEKAFDYQRELGMIDSVSDDHVVARRMGFYDGFIEGAKWHKELMMKEAVEGEAYKFGEVAYVKECNNAELTKYLSQFNNGDRVKIIIVKED